MLFRTAKALILIGAIASTITACGVRGPLEQPPSAKTADGEPVVAGKEKPYRPFILDGLLD